MCKFCEMKDSDLAEEEIMSDQYVNLGIIDSITINTIIQDKNILSTYFMNEVSDVLVEYNTKIKFCPMCGRKLEEE